MRRFEKFEPIRKELCLPFVGGPVVVPVLNYDFHLAACLEGDLNSAGPDGGVDTQGPSNDVTACIMGIWMVGELNVCRKKGAVM